MASDRPDLSPDAKWDMCYDLTLRRFFYSSLVGAATAIVFCRGPITRWGTIAFGAGVGLGSAYTDCSHIMGGALPKWPLPSGVLDSTPSLQSGTPPHSTPEE
ncbi:hypothetical protein KP509_18G029300 [Ceratopteris richardii]|uniref:MICOS complex subunit MIC10 n=1 Tax=Ceratopteris richardii TaxID=49495 RepID=A0A8T2SS43_CERRI|nr:hypothetical protein KP509_18G029300 [Ceratopteris richardii]